MLESWKKKRDEAVVLFEAQSQIFAHHDYNDMDRDWLGAMQVMSRWAGYIDDDTQKHFYEWNTTLTRSVFEVTFFEPIVLGPCKPSEYCHVGCWAGTSQSSFLAWTENQGWSMQVSASALKSSSHSF